MELSGEIENQNKESLTKDNPKDNPNPYEYIRQDFTTEIFKIEISNLPKNTTHPAFLNFLRKKLRLKYSKVKVLPSKFNSAKCQTCHSYVTFKSDQDRQEALKKLSNCQFRGNKLECKESNPLPDPLIIKRLQSEEEHSTINKNDVDGNFEQLSPEEQRKLINNQVCSLWEKSYEEQLDIKLNRLRIVWKECANDLKKIHNFGSGHECIDFFYQTKRLETSSLIRSPMIMGYRNKYEFNVGPDSQVGFRLGLYRHGSIKVVNPPENCPIISTQADKIWRHFQRYLKEKTTLPGYNPVTHQGYWRQILVRHNRNGDALICISLTRQPDELSEENLQEETNKICQHFIESDELGIKSIYLDLIDGNLHRSNQQPRHLYGETHIFERLKINFDSKNATNATNDESMLKFRISPTSFFQINSPAAELLYEKIFSLCGCNENETILLDICCGTGTIGLCLAKYCKRVIGFELNQEAINDAWFNAKHNHLEHKVEYHCGRAEQLLGEVLDKNNIKEQETNYVAILDPPRNGLPSKIIKSLRNNSRIKKVIYVACEAMAARQNFIDLCRPKSNAYNRDPFVPKEAVPVDMFPHTDRCELVLMFERT